MTRGNLSASDATLHLRNLGARARDVMIDGQRGGGEENYPGETEECPRVVFNVPGAVVGVVRIVGDAATPDVARRSGELLPTHRAAQGRRRAVRAGRDRNTVRIEKPSRRYAGASKAIILESAAVCVTRPRKVTQKGIPAVVAPPERRLRHALRNTHRRPLRRSGRPALRQRRWHVYLNGN